MILLENAKLHSSTFHNMVSLLWDIEKEGSNNMIISYELHEDKLNILQDHMLKLKADWTA